MTAAATPVAAVVVAAGRGERMGGAQPKAFLQLGGDPLLLWALRALSRAPSVGPVVAVVPAAEVASCQSLLSGLRGLVAIVAGGATRQDSVACGLAALDVPDDTVVLVHDAARPFVSVELVEAVAAAAREHGAALPLVPLTDTIKRHGNGRVSATLDRTELGAAQTPQGFRLGLLRRASDAARAAASVVTDEAMAVELLGEPVAVVPGSPSNRKLTTPDDLEWAEWRLARHEGRT